MCVEGCLDKRNGFFRNLNAWFDIALIECMPQCAFTGQCALAYFVHVKCSSIRDLRYSPIQPKMCEFIQNRTFWVAEKLGNPGTCLTGVLLRGKVVAAVLNWIHAFLYLWRPCCLDFCLCVLTVAFRRC